MYRKTSNIRRTLVGNKIGDHSDVVGASPVCAAPTTSSFSTILETVEKIITITGLSLDILKMES